MTKEKIHEIWNNLTDEQKAEAEAKKLEIIGWAADQAIALMERRKKEGVRCRGLDGADPEMQQISAEYKRRLNELFVEYGFDPVENL